MGGSSRIRKFSQFRNLENVKPAEKFGLKKRKPTREMSDENNNKLFWTI
jgi:hypothetical protein